MNVNEPEDVDHILIQQWSAPTRWLDNFRQELYAESVQPQLQDTTYDEEQTSSWIGEITEDWPWMVKPTPTISLPPPPLVSVNFEIDDEKVSLFLGGIIEDVHVPGGLLEGFRNVVVPRCFVNRLGQTFFPDPNDFLQVCKEEEYTTPDAFEPPPDLSLPPWHYRRCQPPSPPDTSSQSTPFDDDWVHPYSRPRGPLPRPMRRFGAHPMSRTRPWGDRSPRGGPLSDGQGPIRPPPYDYSPRGRMPSPPQGDFDGPRPMGRRRPMNRERRPRYRRRWRGPPGGHWQSHQRVRFETILCLMMSSSLIRRCYQDQIQYL